MFHRILANNLMNWKKEIFSERVKTPFAAPKTFEWAKQSEAHNTVAAIVLFLSNIIIIESALEQLLDQL